MTSTLPQNFGIHTFTVLPGMQRGHISIPQSFDPEKENALVLALHWGGPVSPETSRSLIEELILPGLGELNAILLAPLRQREHWANVAAAKDLVELLGFIKQNYKIDPHRTLITGYSMGGIGTWQFAAKHPDLFKASIPISAQPPAIVSSMDWKLPTYVIHSEQDEIFPSHYTVDIVKDLISFEAPVHLKMIKSIGHFQIPDFVPALTEASQWVKQIWEDNKDQ